MTGAATGAATDVEAPTGATVPDLARDTEVTRSAKGFEAEVRAEWAVWAPNGGYLAGVALRAVLATSKMPLPGSIHAAFLSAALPGPAHVSVHPLRAGRRAEAFAVSITQPDRHVLAATVWCVAEGEGIVLPERWPAPAGPPPEPPAGERAAEPFLPPALFHRFDTVDLDPQGDAGLDVWNRLWEPPSSLDVEVDAVRQLVFADAFMWPAAMRRYGSIPDSIAPSLDLAMVFHQFSTSPWLRVRATAPIAGKGLAGGSAEVWAPDGRLLSSAVQQMLCSPLPREWVGMPDAETRE